MVKSMFWAKMNQIVRFARNRTTLWRVSTIRLTRIGKSSEQLTSLERSPLIFDFTKRFFTKRFSPRRLRGRSDNVTSDPREDNLRVLRPIPVLNVATYTQGCQAFLNRLVGALQPMKLCNEGFDVIVQQNGRDWEVCITLPPGNGMYKLQTDSENLTLIMDSPISGNHTYVLCSETREWRGEEDGHSLEGLLVRDLIRQCNGYPNF